MPKKVPAERINFLIDVVNDIFSSGQGEAVPSEYHEDAIPALWKEEDVSQEEKVAVFEELYTNPNEYVTITEIQWMMEQCGVKTFSINLTCD